MTTAAGDRGDEDAGILMEQLRDDGVIDLDPRVRALIPVLPADEGEDDDEG